MRSMHNWCVSAPRVSLLFTASSLVYFDADGTCWSSRPDSINDNLPCTGPTCHCDRLCKPLCYLAEIIDAEVWILATVRPYPSDILQTALAAKVLWRLASHSAIKKNSVLTCSLYMKTRNAANRLKGGAAVAVIFLMLVSVVVYWQDGPKK